MQDKAVKNIRALTSQVQGQVFFDPDTYKHTGYDFSLNKHQLTRDQLRDYAILISKLRSSVVDEAVNAFQAASFGS